MTATRVHIAASDCERCRPGLIAQPVNALSSLSYVVVGALVLGAARRRGDARPSEVALGWAAVGAGLGSVAYHGPGTAAGRYVHDASLLAMLGLVSLADAEEVTGQTAPAVAVAAIPSLAALAAHPRSSMSSQVVVGVAATVGEAARMARMPTSGRQAWWRRVEAGIAGAGAVTHLLGRTGGPWCRPDSLFQPHAVWHVATAATVLIRSLDLRR